MNIKNILNKLPDFLLAQLLSLSFVLALTTSLCLTYPYLGTYLIILAASMVFAAALSNRKTLIVSGSILGLVLIAGLIAVIFGAGFQKAYVFLDDYFYWLSDFIENSGVPDAFYQLVTVASLCIGVSLVNYLLIVKRLFFHPLLVTGAAIFTIQWSYGLSSTMFPFYLFLPTILVLYFRYIYKKKASDPNEYVGSGYFTIWAVPICMIAILLAASFHTNDKPLEWKWLDKKISSVYNFINKRFDYEAFDYFSVSSSGFGSKDDILGGRVRLNRTTVLSVDTPRNVYLRGIVKDVYTGTKWTMSSDQKNQIGTDFSSLFEDTDEMVTGMKLLVPDANYINTLFYKDKINVIFQNLRTKSLFLPSKTYSLTPAGKPIKGMSDANGSLSVPERLTKGFGYSVELYSPKAGSKEFADALRKSRLGLYADNLSDLQSSKFLSSALTVSDDSTGGNAAGTSEDSAVYVTAKQDQEDGNYVVRIIDYAEIEKLNALYEKARTIEQKYLQLPDGLPQRVRDLAVSLTGNADNQYDKVKAIEKYLSSNFPYNLDVRSTPRNRDFVDYFLFDLKQGYCTYYASALTVLARCAGIPARYAEGYILPPKPVKEDSKTYIVTNMQAHAWAEIYFEGYGWLPFEATSPFMSNFYSDNTISASISTDYNPAYDDYMDLIRKYTEGKGSDTEIDIPDAVVKKTNYLLIAGIATGAVILIFLTILITNLFRSKLRLFRILSLPPRECVLKLYEYFLCILSLQGIQLQGGETPFQYSDRIDRTLYFDPVKFRNITDIFVRCRYGMEESNDKEKQLVSDFANPFMREVRINMGKMKFFVMKCILGKI